jgi:hypothetical protein
MLKRLLRGILACLLLLTVCALLSADNWDCGIGHGWMIDGGGPWFFTTCTSGPHELCHSHETYPNAAWANRVFEERVQKAITVIERNQKFDSEGRWIGARAVATFNDPKFTRPITSVFWVDDRNINSVNSTSLNMALYVERLEQ